MPSASAIVHVAERVAVHLTDRVSIQVHAVDQGVSTHSAPIARIRVVTIAAASPPTITSTWTLVHAADVGGVVERKSNISRMFAKYPSPSCKLLMHVQGSHNHDIGQLCNVLSAEGLQRFLTTCDKAKARPLYCEWLRAHILPLLTGAPPRTRANETGGVSASATAVAGMETLSKPQRKKKKAVIATIAATATDQPVLASAIDSLDRWGIDNESIDSAQALLDEDDEEEEQVEARAHESTHALDVSVETSLSNGALCAQAEEEKEEEMEEDGCDNRWDKRSRKRKMKAEEEEEEEKQEYANMDGGEDVKSTAAGFQPPLLVDTVSDAELVWVDAVEVERDALPLDSSESVASVELNTTTTTIPTESLSAMADDLAAALMERASTPQEDNSDVSSFFSCSSCSCSSSSHASATATNSTVASSEGEWMEDEVEEVIDEVRDWRFKSSVSPNVVVPQLLWDRDDDDTDGVGTATPLVLAYRRHHPPMSTYRSAVSSMSYANGWRQAYNNTLESVICAN